MSLFYKREESDKEIKIIFKSLAVRMYLLVSFLIGMLLLSNQAEEDLLIVIFLPFLFLAFLAVIIIFTIAYWKPMREIRAALKKGEVKISGSRWSLKRPRTVVIPK